MATSIADSGLPSPRISLWRRFTAIAQPYFFPRIPGGGKITLLLLIMLLVFLFGLLVVLVSGMVLTGAHFAPQLTAKIAGGLSEVVHHIFHSDAVLVVLAILGIPVLVFAGFRRHSPGPTPGLAALGGGFAAVPVRDRHQCGLQLHRQLFHQCHGEKKYESMSYLYVAVYFSGFLVGIPVMAFYSYVRSYMGMHWREWMTGEFLGNYFSNRNYYEVEASGLIDNPDQRIMEDIRSFTRTSLAFLLIVLGSLMDLISFTGILWSKSHLLVVVVLIYSVAGTLLTALIGRRLVRLNFNQLRYEADFRYSLVHVRDNTESIAFYQGEGPEKAYVGERFRMVLKNFSLLIGWQRNLSLFYHGLQLSAGGAALSGAIRSLFQRQDRIRRYGAGQFRLYAGLWGPVPDRLPDRRHHQFRRRRSATGHLRGNHRTG